MTGKKMYVVAAGIIAVCVALIIVFKPKETPPPENGTLIIRDESSILGTVTIEEIRSMPSVKRRVAVNSTSGNSTHDFRGTLLSNVLGRVSPEIVDNYNSVLPVGSDAYMSGISMDEVREENGVYIMYEDNGKPIETLDGQPVGMRIVVLEDMFGQRFTNYLSEIRLRK